MSNPDGLCKCGCGNPAPLAPQNNKNRGYIKDEPLDYIHGHSRRVRRWNPSQPLPLCACGCGERVSISTTTNASREMLRGAPNKYILGHASYKTPFQERDQPLPHCACGCGEQVKTKGSTTLRGHSGRLLTPPPIDEDRGYETLCSIWQGSLSPQGYPRSEIGRGTGSNRTGRTVLRHRQVWIDANGEIPTGMDVHHLCEQPDCVRLEHLDLRPRAEHVRSHHGISPEKYADICRAIRSGEEPQAGIARRFGVSKSYIWRLRRWLLSS